MFQAYLQFHWKRKVCYFLKEYKCLMDTQQASEIDGMWQVVKTGHSSRILSIWGKRQFYNLSANTFSKSIKKSSNLRNFLGTNRFKSLLLTSLNSNSPHNFVVIM